MSWLSSLVEKIPGVGHVLNEVAKPVQGVARGVVENLPGGAAVLGVGDVLGRMVPTPGGTPQPGVPGAPGAPAQAGQSPIPGVSWTDLLGMGGNLAQGIADYSQNEATRKQQADQFNKTYGLQQNQQMLNVANQLNRAPLADKGQYLATNFAAPTAFQPRDLTRGVDQFRQGSQGGAAAQLAANNAASVKYKPGAGGYDSDTLKLVMSRLGGG